MVRFNELSTSLGWAKCCEQIINDGSNMAAEWAWQTGTSCAPGTLIWNVLNANLRATNEFAAGRTGEHDKLRPINTITGDCYDENQVRAMWMSRCNEHRTTYFRDNSNLFNWCTITVRVYPWCVQLMEFLCFATQRNWTNYTRLMNAKIAIYAESWC